MTAAETLFNIVIFFLGCTVAGFFFAAGLWVFNGVTPIFHIYANRLADKIEIVEPRGEGKE